jgi:hypothetical protein
MNCKKNNRNGCGCGGYITTMVDKQTECNEEPCSEIFSSDCVMYLGEEMTNGNITISKGERISEVLQKIMCYMRDESTDVPILRIHDITENSAMVKIMYDDEFTLKYKKSCSEEWESIPTQVTDYLLTNLESGTSYDVKVSGLTDSLTFKFITK